MSATPQDVIALIQESNVLPDASILHTDIPIQDQGIDSLGLFSIMLLIEEKFHLKIEDSDIERLASIESMVAYINERLHQ